MPIAVVDRELSGELCLASSSAFAKDNARPDCRWLWAVVRACVEPEAMAVARLVARAE